MQTRSAEGFLARISSDLSPDVKINHIAAKRVGTMRRQAQDLGMLVEDPFSIFPQFRNQQTPGSDIALFHMESGGTK